MKKKESINTEKHEINIVSKLTVHQHQNILLIDRTENCRFSLNNKKDSLYS